MSDTRTRPSIPKMIWNLLLGRSSKPVTIPKDSWREALETVVFVVVVVFTLKQFIVEAFVIPTGSMAETLFGTNKVITCEKCGYKFRVNSDVEDPADSARLARPLEGYCCPNCRYPHSFRLSNQASPSNTSGDRLLVLKPIYHRDSPQPGDVVVFKYPVSPQVNYGAMNYIKRLWGTGNQTIAIHRGDLYVCESLDYPAVEYPRPESANDLWMPEYRYFTDSSDADSAPQKLFAQSLAEGFPDDGKGFKIIRKSPTLVQEMKRIVYDNDFQAGELQKKGMPARWSLGDGWTRENDGKSFKHTGNQLSWITYQHPLGNPWKTTPPPMLDGKPVNLPGFIDNYLGYNGETQMLALRKPRADDANDGIGDDSSYWVPDLMAECEVQINDPAALVVLDLAKGKQRFLAEFQNGKVTLKRTGASDGNDNTATAATGIDKPGKYRLQFANFDCKLTVWVNGKTVSFDRGDTYPTIPVKELDPLDKKGEGWDTENDRKKPVQIGASGDVTVSAVKIWRDTYFLRHHAAGPKSDNTLSWVNDRDVAKRADTYYVQPGHYLVLGDNSAASSDSRFWGTVPERLMMGKAAVIFFPLNRIGLIK